MDLDWQHRFHAIKDRGFHLLQTETWSDCRFLVGTAPSQKVIAGHKLILAMASPVFERMYFGQFADKAELIVIPDVRPEAFQGMLEYIYSDSINISSFDKACELYYVANKYMLPRVVEQCTHYLLAALSPKNACRAYEFAILFDEPRLILSCLELFAGNTGEVLADSNFTDIEVSTLMAILDLDTLNIDSELDLFNAILRFANERVIVADDTLQDLNNPNSSGNSNAGGMLHVGQIQVEPNVIITVQNHEDKLNGEDFHPHEELSPDVIVVDSASSKTDAAEEGEQQNQVAAGSAIAAPHEQPSTSNAANFNYFTNAQRLIIDEAMIRQAIKKVRFLTMTPQQFAEGPARSKLLENNEALEILNKILSPAINDYPMPEGFCTSRSDRNKSYKLRRIQRDLPLWRSDNVVKLIGVSREKHIVYFSEQTKRL